MTRSQACTDGMHDACSDVICGCVCHGGVSGNLPADDDLVVPVNPRKPKKKGAPIQRSAKQQAAVERAEAKADLAVQTTKAKEDAATLAQVVNLVISGMSYEEIAAGIGATADEVERMVTTGADRYVRTQPALRAWVRNWISAKYTSMIEANIDIATDKNHPDKLENQDRVVRMLTPLARLHGAEAPTQAEVKVEHSSDDVDRLVQQLASREGLHYDTSIFDGDDEDDENTVDAVLVRDTVHDAAASNLAALEQASKHVEMPDPDDEPLEAP